MATAKDKQGFAIIGGVSAILIAGLVAAQQLQPAERDDLGCTSSVPGSTVILLDHSEGIAQQTAREIQQRVLRFVEEEVRTDERISMYAVSDKSSAALMPLFEGCKPPSTGSRLTESQRAIKHRFEKVFMPKLKAALQRRFRESKTSPIAQAVSDLTASEDLSYERSNLLIFSDLIENSTALNMYQCGDGASAIQEYRRNNAGAIERPSFNNVNVQVHIIPRRGISHSTVACRDRFWPWFFGDNSGEQANFNPQHLPG